MKKSRSQYTTFEKMVLPILAFAFFWLVIGDLIIIHERAIFGYDPFTANTPFAKPDKNTSVKLYKDEGQKINKSKGYSFFTAECNVNSNLVATLQGSKFNFKNTFSILKSQSDTPLIVLRGPPAC
ncbi:MAG TPA: hypothetical protein VIN10_07440 [Bacteroidales bacterium]